MRILMVSSFLPYPIMSGGQVRLFNIIKGLSKKHEITLVAEIRENQSDADVKELEKYCKAVYTVKRKKQWTLSNICKAFFSLDSFLIVGHTLLEMQQKIKELLAKESFDCIDVETFYVMQNLPDTHLPIVLTEHNIEYEIYEQYIAQKIPAMFRFLFSWDTWKMKRYETQCWKRAKKLIAVSGIEADKMQTQYLIPNGVDTSYFSFADPTPKFKEKNKKVLFIATFRYLQNITSAEYILQKLWPEIAKRFPDITLWIVGKDIPESLKSYGGDRVVYDTHADDTAAVFHDAHLLLFPAFIAAGTSLKVIEAMSSGLPIVTTPLGVRGLAVKNNESVMTGETAQEMIEKVSVLLEDKKIYTHIATHAREYVEKIYEWKIILKKLEEIFATLHT